MPDNDYTKRVQHLIDAVSNEHQPRHTLWWDAEHYFIHAKSQAEQVAAFTQTIRHTKDKAVSSALTKKRQMLVRDIEHERLERLSRIDKVIEDILALVEGDTYEETGLSARFLGTLLLLTPGQLGNFAALHQQLKPIYKAVLALRLADEILAHKKVTHPYLRQFLDAGERFNGNEHCRENWRTRLAIPIIKACLLQDIGLKHPDARAICADPMVNKANFDW